METKTCTKCNKQKNLNEFYQKNHRGRFSSSCRECFNQYCVERWQKRKIEAIIYKGSQCVDCGISYPNISYVIFDFHHLEPSKKDFEWTKLRLKSWNKILPELDKCVLICSNCHRLRHYEERGSST